MLLNRWRSIARFGASHVAACEQRLQYYDKNYKNLRSGGKGSQLATTRYSAPAFAVKDRSPFPGTEVENGRKKMGVLVDASKIDPKQYLAVEPLIVKNDVDICLRRFFQQLPQPSHSWRSMVHMKKFEFFRVDSFVPINIQMAADAAHIITHSGENKLNSLCFVVDSSEAEAYVKLFGRLQGNKFSLYVFDSGECRGYHAE